MQSHDSSMDPTIAYYVCSSPVSEWRKLSWHSSVAKPRYSALTNICWREFTAQVMSEIRSGADAQQLESRAQRRWWLAMIGSTVQHHLVLGRKRWEINWVWQGKKLSTESKNTTEIWSLIVATVSVWGKETLFSLFWKSTFLLINRKLAT